MTSPMTSRVKSTPTEEVEVAFDMFPPMITSSLLDSDSKYVSETEEKVVLCGNSCNHEFLVEISFFKHVLSFLQHPSEKQLLTLTGIDIMICYMFHCCPRERPKRKGVCQ